MMQRLLFALTAPTGLLAALSLSSVLAAAPLQPLQPFEADSLARIIDSHRGKPFVVMVWSLDCEYCQASFATLAELRRRKGIDIVTIATDAAADPQSAQAISAKLAPSGLTGNAWAFGNAAPEQLRYRIDPKWRGELPRSYWFNAQGERVAHSGVISSELADRMTR